MPLLIQPLFGAHIIVPFIPHETSWSHLYRYLHVRYYNNVELYQLRLYHNESPDLSNVKDGDTLHLFVSDGMVERWVSEHSVDTQCDGIVFHHSNMTWYDIRWGDPYENPAVTCRTSLTIHVLMREQDGTRSFMLNPEYFKEQYTTRNKSPGIWYPTVRDACYSFRDKYNTTEGEEVVSEKTVEHLIHLWELYHGTQKHLVNQGRYYDE